MRQYVPLARAMQLFALRYNLDDSQLASWLEVQPEDLPILGQSLCPEMGSPKFYTDCALIARAFGGDPWALRFLIRQAL